MKEKNKIYSSSLKRGQIVVFMLFFISVMMATSALVVDLGMMQLQKQEMRKAADAASLACSKFMYLDNGTRAEEVAREYAGYNGFVHGENGVNVFITRPVLGKDNILHNNWIRVELRKPFKFIFGRILGFEEANLQVASSAMYNVAVGLDINLFGGYGQDNPDVVLAICGAMGEYIDGDPNVKYLSRNERNNEYNKDGYSYFLTIPPNYAYDSLCVELLDPGYAGTNTGFDMYKYDKNGKTNVAKFHYKLYENISTDPASVTWREIGLYETDTRTPRSQWLEAWTITGNIKKGSNAYRVQVYDSQGTVATDDGGGAGLNGFSLRAGPIREPVMTNSQTRNGYYEQRTNSNSKPNPPPNSATILNDAGVKNRYKGINSVSNISYDDYERKGNGNNRYYIHTWTFRYTLGVYSIPPFDQSNGISIQADGRTEIYFKESTTMEMVLCFIPERAKGSSFTVRKFDDDIGGQANQTNYYYIESSDGLTATGPTHRGEDPSWKVPGKRSDQVNGKWTTDTIKIPDDYKGGIWFCNYKAGQNDLSQWILDVPDAGDTNYATGVAVLVE